MRTERLLHTEVSPTGTTRMTGVKAAAEETAAAAAEETSLHNVTAAAQMSHIQTETMRYPFTLLLM